MPFFSFFPSICSFCVWRQCVCVCMCVCVCVCASASAWVSVVLIAEAAAVSWRRTGHNAIDSADCFVLGRRAHRPRAAPPAPLPSFVPSFLSARVSLRPAARGVQWLFLAGMPCHGRRVHGQRQAAVSPKWIDAVDAIDAERRITDWPPNQQPFLGGVQRASMLLTWVETKIAHSNLCSLLPVSFWLISSDVFRLAMRLIE